MCRSRELGTALELTDDRLRPEIRLSGRLS